MPKQAKSSGLSSATDASASCASAVVCLIFVDHPHPLRVRGLRYSLRLVVDGGYIQIEMVPSVWERLATITIVNEKQTISRGLSSRSELWTHEQ